MMKFCSIGRVIDALAAIPLTDTVTFPPSVVVSDGPWNQAVLPDEIVAIGLRPTLDTTNDSNSGTQTPRSAGLPLQMFEQYDVMCGIRSWDGDPAANKKVRDRALQMFSVYEQALRTNPTLSGMVQQQIVLQNVELLQNDPDVGSGASANIYFTVHVENLLTS